MWEWAHDGEGSWEKQGKFANRHQGGRGTRRKEGWPFCEVKQLRMEMLIAGKPEDGVNIEGRVYIKGHRSDLRSQRECRS